MAGMLPKDVSNCATTMNGGLCAMTTGMSVMLGWYADSWDYQIMVCIVMHASFGEVRVP